MDKRRSFGLLGAALVCCGVFTPTLTAPMLGNISYLLCGKGDGTILIALSLLSFYLAMKKKYRALWYTGLASFGVVAFTFYDIYRRLSELNDGAAQTYHLSWGWAVLAAGIGTIIASAALREKSARIADSSVVPET